MIVFFLQAFAVIIMHITVASLFIWLIESEYVHRT